jgi:hypothetical protein
MKQIFFISLFFFVGTEFQKTACASGLPFKQKDCRSILSDIYKVNPFQGNTAPYPYLKVNNLAQYAINQKFQGVYYRVSELAFSLKEAEDIKRWAVFFSSGVEDKVAKEEVLSAHWDRGVREISLDTFLPHFAQCMNNKSPTGPGPNCFNASINWNVEDFLLKEVSEIELLSELMTNYQKLEKGEASHFGDLVLIREQVRPRRRVHHTMRLVHPDYVWHKAGNDIDTPWTFEDFSEVLAFYKKNYPDVNFEIEIFRERSL